MGIRQFQQFGGAPITIWRGLRKTSVGIPEDILQKAFEAADNGDWAEFLVVMGGPAPLKKNQPIHIAKTESSELGKYGDPIGKKFIGLTIELFTLPTRTLTWEILNLAKLKERLAEIFGSPV